jgi:hypothetical protein
VHDDLGGRWSLSWRRALFQWETDLLDKLLQILDFVNLTLVEDVWRWVPDPNGFFTVSSAYNLLVKELRTSNGLAPDVALVFEQIWESPAPSKVIVFSWQLLYDRIPTKCNRDHRSILSPDVSRDCVGCVGFVESSTRLFLHCSSAIAIWYELFKWLGVVIVIPPNFSFFLKCLEARLEIEKSAKVI